MSGRITGSEVLRRAKAAVPSLEAESLAAGLEAAGTIVDVREGEEWRNGHLPGALHLPRGHLEMQAESKLPDLDAPIVLYCAGGNRSALAARSLSELGYTNLKHLHGGYTAWKDGGFPFEVPHQWTTEQLKRYSRHFLLPEVGQVGQMKLKNGKVLVVGAGGLGAPALYYLAAAGVGTIGIIDFDDVEESNLQRQIIHATSRVGMNKAESAAMTIADLNPDVKVKIWTKPLVPSNVDEIMSGFDVVIDGTDNFKTRYLANEAAFRHQIPYVYGSIFRFEGYRQRVRSGTRRAVLPMHVSGGPAARAGADLQRGRRPGGSPGNNRSSADQRGAEDPRWIRQPAGWADVDLRRPGDRVRRVQAPPGPRLRHLRRKVP